jgi:hypothetical protein
MLRTVMMNVIMLSVVMLSAFMLGVIMLSVIMLSVVMLNVVVPREREYNIQQEIIYCLGRICNSKLVCFTNTTQQVHDIQTASSKVEKFLS